MTEMTTPARPSSSPLPPGGHAPLASGPGAESRRPVTLDELRRLSGGAVPLSPDEVPPDRTAEALAFNGVVARFREQVVLARNLVILGRGVPEHLGLELRALAEALPGERARATGPALTGHLDPPRR